MTKEIGLKPDIFCFIRVPRLESRGNMNKGIQNVQRAEARYFLFYPCPPA